MSKKEKERDSEPTPRPKPRPSDAVRASLAVCWRCPSCALYQIAERSKAHVSECRRCGMLIEVVVLSNTRDRLGPACSTESLEHTG